MKVTENDLTEIANTACMAPRQSFQDNQEKILESMNRAIEETDDDEDLAPFAFGFNIKADLDSQAQKHKFSFKGPTITSESTAHITLEEDDQPELDLEGDGGLKGAGTGDSGAPLEPEV